MNKFENELLKIAYENYRKSGKATGVTIGRNGDEIFHYSNALDSLVEQEYVIPTSDNYDPNSINILAPRVSYELTDKGFQYALANLAD